MTKSKHTPGPWEREAQAIRIQTMGWPINDPRDGSRLAVVLGEKSEELRANARLIAAAPDLLAALRKLIDVTPVEYDYAGEPMDREFGAALTEAEAILARIEGE